MFCVLLNFPTLIAEDSIAHPGESGACGLCALRLAIEKSVTSTVYYGSVKDPELRKVRLIRFDYSPGSTVKESYIDSSRLRTKNWEHALSKVKGPAQTNIPAELQAKLNGLKTTDAGKLVLFEDRSGLHITPELLGLNPSALVQR